MDVPFGNAVYFFANIVVMKQQRMIIATFAGIDRFDIVIAELLSSVVVGTTIAAFAGYAAKRYECCDSRWIVENVTGKSIVIVCDTYGIKTTTKIAYYEFVFLFLFEALRSALKSRLYGQHLVLETIVPELRAYFDNRKPEKALVMSFHGTAGTSKNYVTTLIAEHMYTNRVNSAYFYQINNILHFSHSDDIETHKVCFRC